MAAFVNQTNAQNLSCRALAEHFDKDKFEVFTLQIKHGNLPYLTNGKVKIFNCTFPVKITGVIGLFWGYMKADVVYIPRGDFLRWHKILQRVFSVVTFKTVRNIIDQTAMKSALSHLNKQTDGNISEGYNFVRHLYAMTPFMREFNSSHWGLKFENVTLLPPSETKVFARKSRVRTELKNIVFIGNDWPRKGLGHFLDAANQFPDIHFHVVGKGNKKDFLGQIDNKNVTFHGLVTGENLVNVVSLADLNILPSTSEGLPRVWIETLANGLPSIMYYGYGIEDYLQHGHDGFMAKGCTEMKDVIQYLLDSPGHLQSASENALISSKSYAPNVLTRTYELEIERMLDFD